VDTSSITRMNCNVRFWQQHGRPDISSRCPPSGGEGRPGPLVTLVRSGQNRCPTGKSPRTCAALSSPCSKNISLNPSGKSALPACPVSPDERGVAHVTTRGVGCGGRGACERRTQTLADGEVVWSWRPDAGAKFVKTHPRLASDGGKKARSPGRARSKP
jgi:hypothetical protein